MNKLRGVNIMLKKIKFAAAAALAFVMACSMAGCSSSSDTSADSSASSASASGETASDDVIKIGIIQLLEHDALDSAREGFIQTLKDNGYIDGENIIIDYQNAQNDQSNLKTISQRFVQEEDDLILAIATGAAQSVAAETSEIPILGTAITDYEAAQLVESNDAPGGNVSGTTDLNPVDKQLDLLKEMLPEVFILVIMIIAVKMYPFHFTGLILSGFVKCLYLGVLYLIALFISREYRIFTSLLKR